MKNTNKKGFTIIELAIVIAVIAILAAVLIPTFSGIIEKANVSSAEQAARNAYTQYVADNAGSGSYEGKVCVKVVDGSKVYYVFINNGSVLSDATLAKKDLKAENIVAAAGDVAEYVKTDKDADAKYFSYEIDSTKNNTLKPATFTETKSN